MYKLGSDTMASRASNLAHCLAGQCRILLLAEGQQALDRLNVLALRFIVEHVCAKLKKITVRVV
jgi:ABC-type nitrate/sulfonate/bicarbonate transport system ATPase subunit